jgi:hypothetical protein
MHVEFHRVAGRTAVAKGVGSPRAAHGVAPALLLLMILVFYVSTMRDGHIWDDDAAQYILHARNIAEGRPYLDTGYIFNPEYANLGPPGYPPGFPLLLAPIWALRGLDLRAMKLLEAGFFVIGLGMVYACFRIDLSAAVCLALVAILGFSPSYWDFKEFIASEFPFLAFLFLAFLVIEHVYSRTGLPPVRFAVPIALCIVLAYSIRAVGGLLVPSLAAYEVLRRRRLSACTVVTCFVAVVLCGAEALWLHSAGGNLSLFQFRPIAVLNSVVTYAALARSFWRAGSFRALSWLVSCLVTALAGWAVFDRLRAVRQARLVEVFAVFYLPVLLAWSSKELRFLFPLFPLFLAYSLSGAERFIRRLPARWPLLVAGAALAAVAVCYSAQYRQLNWHSIQESFLDRDFLAVTGFVRDQTVESDVILFRRPRFVPLLTGRRALTYAHATGLGAFVRGIHPNYVIAANSRAGVFASDARFLWPSLRAHPDTMQLVFHNNGYSVFRALAW